MGLKGISFDVLNGWDFTVKANRDWVKEELRLNPPELLLSVRYALTQGAGSTLTPCTCPVVKFEPSTEVEDFHADCQRLDQATGAAGG